MLTFFGFRFWFTVPIWADPRDAEEIDERMVKIKADLLSELAAVRTDSVVRKIELLCLTVCACRHV